MALILHPYAAPMSGNPLAMAAQDAPDTPAPPVGKNAGFHAEQAYELLGRGQRRAAAAAFSTALALDPRDSRAGAWQRERNRLLNHWSGYAYALVGRDSQRDLLNGSPRLGGSQTGARLGWRLDPLAATPIDIVARAFAPLKGRDATHALQTAIGVEWRPARSLPATIALERYVAAGRNARDSWAARLSGGIDDVRLGPAILAAYGEAGMVGARRQDLFIDGTIRVGRDIASVRTLRLNAGLGAWGGAQPGVSRLDIGPGLTLAVPVGNAVIAADLDWRWRIAGNARPGSGPTLTLRTGF